MRDTYSMLYENRMKESVKTNFTPALRAAYDEVDGDDEYLSYLDDLKALLDGIDNQDEYDPISDEYIFSSCENLVANLSKSISRYGMDEEEREIVERLIEEINKLKDEYDF